MCKRVLPSFRFAPLVALLCSLALAFGAHADVTRHAAADSVSSKNSSAEVAQFGRARHAVFFAGSFNADDGNIGLTYRFYLFPEQELGLFAAMTGRFWDEVVRVPFRPGAVLQVRETRQLWMAGIHKSIGGRGPIGAFTDVGAGYTTANYDGVRLEPEEGWTFFLRSGAMLSFRSDSLVGEAWRLELGYQYADLKVVAENWFYAAVGVLF